MRPSKMGHLALMMAAMGGMDIDSEVKKGERRNTVNPHNYPKFEFEYEGEKYFIYAYNEIAAKEKFDAIIKKKTKHLTK